LKKSSSKTRKAMKVEFMFVINAEESLILTEKEVDFPDQLFINQVMKRKKTSVGFAVIVCN